MHICLFDIDGTLLLTGGAGQAAMEAVIASEFGSSRPVEGIPTAGRTDRAIVADLFRYYGLEPDDGAWERFLKAYLRHLPRHLAECDGTVLPGIPPLLETLGGRDDVILGLLTGNFREGARLKLEHYALDAYFTFGGFGDHHLHRDDVAREALAEVRRRCGEEIDPQRIWVIGDTPSDVRCGRAIGANVFAVGTGMFSMDALAAEGPDHLCCDLADPGPLLRLLT